MAKKQQKLLKQENVKKKHQKKNKKIPKWIIVVAIILLLFIVFGSSNNNNDTKNNQNTDKTETVQQKDKKESTKTKLNNLKGKSLEEAIKVTKELKYDAKYLNDGGDNYDFTSEIEDLVNTGWVIKEVSDIKEVRKKVTFYITTPEALKIEKEKEKLEKKLDSTTAETAMVMYGEKKYPYGFKLNRILGNFNQTMHDKNTWKIKSDCTITNAYGTDMKATCEAKIKGTTNNPIVFDFYVY